MELECRHCGYKFRWPPLFSTDGKQACNENCQEQLNKIAERLKQTK
jgi:hypothetical protein